MDDGSAGREAAFAVVPELGGQRASSDSQRLRDVRSPTLMMSQGCEDDLSFNLGQRHSQE